MLLVFTRGLFGGGDYGSNYCSVHYGLTMVYWPQFKVKAAGSYMDDTEIDAVMIGVSKFQSDRGDVDCNPLDKVFSLGPLM